MLDLALEDQLFASTCRDPRPEHGIAEWHGVAGFVYVIAPADNDFVCKVGSARSLQQRLNELQCGSWSRLRVAAAVAVVASDPRSLEFAVHARLRTAGKHRHLEWFNVDEVTAVNTIVAVACALNIKVKALSEMAAARHCEAMASAGRRREDERRKLRLRLGIDDSNC